jgi:formylglycine-generating enzyme required for sulfatase activity
MKNYLPLVLVLCLLGACGAEPTPTLSAGDTWTRPADDVEMVYVPAGEFLMGSTDDDRVAAYHERPQHTVYLDAYWIDKHEVTNDQYRQCVEAGACQAPQPCEFGKASYEDATKGNHPVVCVNWYHAQDYAAWVGGRLPTEAEWEKAARGIEGQIYPWGDSPPDCSKAHYSGCGEAAALPVGSRPDGASPYGAMDMAGNVLEWVADWYDADFYVGSPVRNPQGPESGKARVERSGAFDIDEWAVRCALRHSRSPSLRNLDRGFRVVVAPGPSEP